MKKQIEEIIIENIEYFWENDTILEQETEEEKLWNAFELWCISNCMEIFEGINQAIIEEEVKKYFDRWKQSKKEKDNDY